MKNVKKFVQRGAMFAWGGPFITAIVWMCLKGAGVITVLSVEEVVLGIISTTIMALVDSTQTEVYNANVLTATEGMFRFQHEYKPNFWERAEMTKIGTINPNAKDIFTRATSKRKENGPVFNLK